jgi:hypothetical protein
MRLRTVLLASIAVAGLAAPAGGGIYFPCLDGAFDVQGPPLVVAGTNGSDTLQLLNLTASTSGGCPPATAKLRGGRLGTRVRAVWKGCGGLLGPHRLSVMIDRATCNTMIGTLKSRGQPRRSFVAQRQVGGPPPSGSTWDDINALIFGVHGCAVSTCHGPFKQANLDLRAGTAYANLINVASVMAPGKTRVVPGSSAASFLSQKLHGTQGATEGAQMPLIGQTLSALELQVLDAWIDAGAPQTGVVPGVPTLPQPDYVVTPQPPVPPGGYQLVLDGPFLLPGQEQEGCLWTPIPWSGSFVVGKWEFSLNPGTHHFAVYQNRVASPPVGQWLQNDFGCFGEGEFYSTTGSPQAPYYVDAYPDGVGRAVTGGAGKYLGLNAHYHNYWDHPIQIRVWINVYPFAGTPQHYAQSLYDLGTTFGIFVPPFVQKLQYGHFVNYTGKTLKFFTLSGHMHKRGLRFTTYRSDGTKLYDNYDWAHPLNVLYDPPLELAPGDWLDYECLHDNGVSRAVKRDTLGTPIPVQFGVTTDDEMCILPGSYYTD